jgi:hypothetical protein
MPATVLRHLFVTVQEREPGCFTWVLLEATAPGDLQSHEEIASSPRSLDNYSQAIREGAEALAKLARRDRIGPRAVGRGTEHVIPPEAQVLAT